MRRENTPTDIAEYVLGVPLFFLVAAATAAVMAIGFPIAEGISWLRHRG